MKSFKPPVNTTDDNDDIGKNPFSYGLKIPVRSVYKKNEFYVDRDGDKLPSKYKAEYIEYCKIYTLPSIRKKVCSLKPTSVKLLNWIIFTISPGSDYLWINKSRCLNECNISYNTYKSAIKELHQEAIIAPSVKKDVYWINPTYFFNGNRLSKYPDNIIDHTKFNRDEYK